MHIIDTFSDVSARCGLSRSSDEDSELDEDEGEGLDEEGNGGGVYFGNAANDGHQQQPRHRRAGSVNGGSPRGGGVSSSSMHIEPREVRAACVWGCWEASPPSCMHLLLVHHAPLAGMQEQQEAWSVLETYRQRWLCTRACMTPHEAGTGA